MSTFFVLFMNRSMDETLAAQSLGSETLKDRFTLRIQWHVTTQPASCCFLIAIIFIVIAMAALGVYVQKKDVMPDLDSMKVLLGNCEIYTKIFFVPFRTGMHI